MLQLDVLGKYTRPYLVLQNLVCHINYGGRITDDWDRRMVMCLLQGVLNEGIMSDDPLAPGEHYRSPPAGNPESYREVIANVPLNPHPNVFGLHANAEIACAQNETQELCEIMLGLQAQTAPAAASRARTWCARPPSRCSSATSSPSTCTTWPTPTRSRTARA